MHNAQYHKQRLNQLEGASLEDYVKRKLPHIQEKIKHVDKLETDLSFARAELEMMITNEVEELKASTGLNSLQSKIRGLSEAANEKLLGEKQDD